MRKTVVVLAALLALIFSATAAAAAPRHHRVNAPGNVSASVSGSTATLHWSAPSGHVTGYYVARDGKDSHGGGLYSTVIASTRRSFTFTLLLPGSTYHLTVAARDGSSQSAPVVKTVSIAAPPKLTITADRVQAVNSKQPYGPQYDSVGLGFNQGGYDCQLDYHEYAVTTGCGGAWAYVRITGLASFPGGLASQGTLDVYADLARTFGCVGNATHVFRTVEVIRQTQLHLSAVHANATFTPPGGDTDTTTSNNMLIASFVNFQPVAFSCAPGETKAQFGLKVSNLKAVVADPVTGTRTATFPGPWYSPPEIF